MARQPEKSTAQLWLESLNAYEQNEQQERMQRYARENAEEVRSECLPFLGFVKHAWPILEPNTPLVVGWGIEAIIDHLAAVSADELNRLWINVPPGFAKSLLLNVLWPAHEWGALNRPWLRYVATSGDESLTTRDGKKFRDLINSPWYQELYPHVRLTSQAIGEMNNDKTGARYGVPFSGMMGWRGDRLCIDDPHNLKNEKSDAMRGEQVRLFKEGASSRLNDVVKGAIIGVMQMVGPDDISTYVKSDPSYTYLCIPQEFERERKCITFTKAGRKIFEDPRKNDGDLAFPERFPREWIEKEKSAKGIGAFAYASQHQQNPIPRGGGMFQRDWFDGKIITMEEALAMGMKRKLRFWDLADTDLKALQGTGARTAGVKMAITKDDDIIIMDAKVIAKSGAKKNLDIKNTVKADGRDIEQFVAQDPASGGKVQARQMIKLMKGYNARAVIEKGDKVSRAEPFSAQAEAGNVYLIKGAWNKDYLDELEVFPNAKRKDQVDASANAYAQLLKKKTSNPNNGSGLANLGAMVVVGAGIAEMTQAE